MSAHALYCSDCPTTYSSKFIYWLYERLILLIFFTMRKINETPLLSNIVSSSKRFCWSFRCPVQQPANIVYRVTLTLQTSHSLFEDTKFATFLRKHSWVADNHCSVNVACKRTFSDLCCCCCLPWLTRGKWFSFYAFFFPNFVTSKLLKLKFKP